MAGLPPLSDEERENLVAYLDGELHGAQATAMEARLSVNPQARAEAESLKRTWQLLDYLPKPESSHDFKTKTLSRITVHRPTAASARGWRQWLAVTGWAAAVVAALALGFTSGQRWSRPLTTGNVDRALLQNFSVIENRHLYQHVDNIEFLKSLADVNDPDLFGDESSGG
jgi:anti-sigma factor RsiW